MYRIDIDLESEDYIYLVAHGPGDSEEDYVGYTDDEDIANELCVLRNDQADSEDFWYTRIPVIDMNKELQKTVLFNAISYDMKRVDNIWMKISDDVPDNIINFNCIYTGDNKNTFIMEVAAGDKYEALEIIEKLFDDIKNYANNTSLEEAVKYYGGDYDDRTK